jgi:hypothetical protein
MTSRPALPYYAYQALESLQALPKKLQQPASAELPLLPRLQGRAAALLDYDTRVLLACKLTGRQSAREVESRRLAQANAQVVERFVSLSWSVVASDAQQQSCASVRDSNALQDRQSLRAPSMATPGQRARPARLSLL